MTGLPASKSENVNSVTLILHIGDDDAAGIGRM